MTRQSLLRILLWAILGSLVGYLYGAGFQWLMYYAWQAEGMFAYSPLDEGLRTMSWLGTYPSYGWAIGLLAGCWLGSKMGKS